MGQLQSGGALMQSPPFHMSRQRQSFDVTRYALEGQQSPRGACPYQGGSLAADAWHVGRHVVESIERVQRIGRRLYAVNNDKRATVSFFEGRTVVIVEN
jgi:hypothetical protein